MKLFSNAKINLLLKVTNKRKDSYHDIYSIMQSIDLCDRIEIKEIKSKDIIITSNSKEIPCNQLNTAYKAAQIMLRFLGSDSGISIDIQKQIPVEAGLAGGSSNAAAVIMGINYMFNANIPLKTLMDLSVMVGADVPFCLTGGTALVQGIGDKIEKIDDINKTYILLINPDIKISTSWAYQNLKHFDSALDAEYKNVIRAINNRDKNTLNEIMINTFEHIVIDKYPEIKDIKDKLLEYNAFVSLMSGSGSTVFGLFENYEDANRAKTALKEIYNKTYLTTTKLQGVDINVK